MGKGFCFVSRQKRLTIEGDHFYVDLVFYNRLLRCFVLVDLKLSKLTHQDLGQRQMYVNYYDRTQRAQHESKTIGIVLCSEKNAAMVKITLPEDNDQIIAATYRRYLPTEAELAAELEALATARPLQLIPIGGGIELGACGRRELDDFHDRFLSRARPSANTVSAGMPGAFSPIRRSISVAHAAVAKRKKNRSLGPRRKLPSDQDGAPFEEIPF
jgi:hypothetical protein